MSSVYQEFDDDNTSGNGNSHSNKENLVHPNTTMSLTRAAQYAAIQKNSYIFDTAQIPNDNVSGLEKSWCTYTTTNAALNALEAPSDPNQDAFLQRNSNDNTISPDGDFETLQVPISPLDSSVGGMASYGATSTYLSLAFLRIREYRPHTNSYINPYVENSLRDMTPEGLRLDHSGNPNSDLSLMYCLQLGTQLDPKRGNPSSEIDDIDDVMQPNVNMEL